MLTYDTEKQSEKERESERDISKRRYCHNLKCIYELIDEQDSEKKVKQNPYKQIRKATVWRKEKHQLSVLQYEIISVWFISLFIKLLLLLRFGTHTHTNTPNDGDRVCVCAR